MPEFKDTKKTEGKGRASGGFQRTSSPGTRRGKQEGGRSRRAQARAMPIDNAAEWLMQSMLLIQEDPWLHFMLFGPTGVGKSIAAASMPRALVMACDRHANWAFRDAERERISKLFPNTMLQFRPVRIVNFHDMWAAYKVLEHGCVTGQWPLDQPLWSWVIDGMTELQQVGADKVLDDSRHDAPDTHDYTLMKTDLRSLMLDLMKLPMHGLITCGEKNAGTMDDPKMIPAFTGALAEELPTHMDVVGRIGITGDNRRAVSFQPGPNHWAKDLTGRLGDWGGQNLQNWLHKALGPDWRQMAGAARDRKPQEAPKTDGPEAAPHPAADGEAAVGTAPGRVDPQNASLETPADTAEGKPAEVPEQAGETGTTAPAVPPPASPPVATGDEDMWPKDLVRDQDLVPPTQPEPDPEPDGGVPAEPSQVPVGETPGEGPPAQLNLTGETAESGGGLQPLAVAPQQQQQTAAPPPDPAINPGPQMESGGNPWQPGMQCLYGLISQGQATTSEPPTRLGMVVGIDEQDPNTCIVRSYDRATGKLAGRPARRHWQQLAPVPAPKGEGRWPPPTASTV